jgi:hypothetical protein
MKPSIKVALVCTFVVLGFLPACCGESQLVRDLLDRTPAMSVLTREQIEIQARVSKADLIYRFDKAEILRKVARSVTANAATDEQRVVLWVQYVQDRVFHSVFPPIDEDGTAIYDPVWVLKNRIGHCGQTNRLLVDGLNRIGIRTRLIQLADHVAAETFFDGGWHFIDADVVDFHQVVRDNKGAIPSAREITADPDLLSSVTQLAELAARGYTFPGWDLRNSFRTTVDAGTGLTTPFVWKKTATPEQERNEYFGWNYYVAEPLEP